MSNPTVDVLLAAKPTDAERRRIRRELNYSFDNELMHGPWEWVEDPDPDQGWDINLTVYQLFKVMRAIRFESPLPWTDKTLYNWFRSAVQGVRFRHNIDLSYCCEPAGFINIKGDELEDPRHRYWIQPQVGTGMWGLVSLVIHEARHAEGYPHTAGTDRDETLAEMGAYAVQYYFDVWIAEHSPPDFFSQYHRDCSSYQAEWTKEHKIVNP